MTSVTGTFDSSLRYSLCVFPFVLERAFVRGLRTSLRKEQCYIDGYRRLISNGKRGRRLRMLLREKRFLIAVFVERFVQKEMHASCIPRLHRLLSDRAGQ